MTTRQPKPYEYERPLEFINAWTKFSSGAEIPAPTTTDPSVGIRIEIQEFMWTVLQRAAADTSAPVGDFLWAPERAEAHAIPYNVRRGLDNANRELARGTNGNVPVEWGRISASELQPLCEELCKRRIRPGNCTLVYNCGNMYRTNNTTRAHTEARGPDGAVVKMCGVITPSIGFYPPRTRHQRTGYGLMLPDLFTVLPNFPGGYKQYLAWEICKRCHGPEWVSHCGTKLAADLAPHVGL